MDRIDLIAQYNDEHEYQPRQQRLEELAQMLQQTGQDTMIAEAIRDDGMTIGEMADNLGELWDVDPELLAQAIERALAAL